MSIIAFRTYTELYIFCSLLQTGAFPLHSPVLWQTRAVCPTRRKPLLQLYVALEFTVVLVKDTSPLVGSDKRPQSMTAYEINLIKSSSTKS